MIKYSGLFFGLFLLGACSGSETEEPELPAHLQDIENLTVYPADVEPAFAITLTQDAVYQSTEEHLMMIGGSDGNIVEVDLEGRVYIPDQLQKTFHVLSPDGQYLRRLSREGRGPGEIGPDSGINPQIANNRLYVYDIPLSRISVFDLETMGLFNTIDINPQEWSQVGDVPVKRPSQLYVQNDSTILLKISTRQQMDVPINYYYLYINSAGERVSDIVLQQVGADPLPYWFEGRQFSATIEPFQEEPLLAVTEDGRIVGAQTGEFLINIYQADGVQEEAIYYPFEKKRLIRDELIEEVDVMGRDYPSLSVARSVDLPEFWPALYENMVVDDENRLWVSTIVEDNEVYQWWVLDLDDHGRLLARFEWPRTRYIEVVKNGHMYTREWNEEQGISQVIRYQIELNEI